MLSLENALGHHIEAMLMKSKLQWAGQFSSMEYNRLLKIALLDKLLLATAIQ